MAYKIIVDPNAKRDIVESIDWYNKAREGLGFRFYEQVQATFKKIQNNPNSFVVRYKTSHTAIVKKFPFLVHYFIDSEIETIIVVAVLHTSRDPNIWDERG